MGKTHSYKATLVWDNSGGGKTTDYRSYSRSHEIQVPGKSSIRMSADAAFLGAAELHNPEDCLVMALSSCHLLTYLALAGRAGLEVIQYTDAATGEMVQEGGGGRFTEVTLNPTVTIAPGGDADLALRLHEEAHRDCFIASSVNFPVKHHATIRIA